MWRARYLVFAPILAVVAVTLPGSGATGDHVVPPPPPPEHQALYAELSQTLTEFEAQLDAEWNGGVGPNRFAQTLAAANGNKTIALLSPNSWYGSLAMLDAYEAMGVEVIKLEIHYPLFTQAFHGYLAANPPPAYNPYTAGVDNFIGQPSSFFNRIASEIRSRGLGLWIEHGTLFTDFSPTPPTGYFGEMRALGINAARQRYSDERSAEAALVVSQLAPDHYTILEEPETQNANFGYFPGNVPLNGPSEWQDFVEAAAAAIAAAAPGSSTLLGAGMGTWDSNSYVQLFAPMPELDYIDFHIYPLETTGQSFRQNALDWADYVRGVDPSKKLLIGEAWLYKASVDDLVSGLHHNVIFGRDVWSFWEPLDRQYHDVLFKLMHHKDFELVMPFWVQYYFAYIDYGDPTVEGMSGPELVAEAGRRAAPNILSLTFTGTGEKIVELLGAEPPTFHCTYDAACPEIMIGGDPHASAAFRGYGDPSLERDPDTGMLWLSYSWLDILVSNPGPPPVYDFGVRTHLARSDANGATFSFERSVNATEQIMHPDTSAQGWTIHEVSTVVREGPGAWQMMWLSYFDPLGQPPPGTDHRSDFYYARSTAASAQSLGDVATPWLRTNGTSASWGVVHNVSSMPELSDCAALTEPALFAQGGSTYLASNCVVFIDGVRRDDLERLVLLREETNGYSYVGELVDYADAVYLGGTRLEQSDIAVAANGAILLIVTPIQNTQPNHLGCVVLEITDIGAAQVRRDAAGDPVKLAVITGEDSTIGPGLCTYDASSTTGVLMVLHAQSQNPPQTVFSLRATGVHPNGVDSDGDGVADSADANDDNDMLSDAAEIACGSDPLAAASLPERVDGQFAGVDDDGDAQVDEGLPAGGSSQDCDGDGFKGAAEDHVFSYLTGPPIDGDQKTCQEYDASFPSPASHIRPSKRWPADLASSAFSLNKINIQDLSSFTIPIRYLNQDVGTDPADIRFDLAPGTTSGFEINIADMATLTVGATAYPAMLGGMRAFAGPDCPYAP